MFKYVEKIGRILDARTVETGKFFTLEVDYVTAGGVSKTLTLAHSDADMLRSTIENSLAELPDDRRKRSFFASLKRRR